MRVYTLIIDALTFVAYRLTTRRHGTLCVVLYSELDNLNHQKLRSGCPQSENEARVKADHRLRHENATAAVDATSGSRLDGEVG